MRATKALSTELTPTDPVLTGLVAGLPVRFGTQEDRSEIEWRDGMLCFDVSKSISMMGRGRETIWAHDIGHVIGATDEELRRPNMGLPINVDFKGQIGPCLSPEDIIRTETYAVGTQLLVYPKQTERSIKLSKILFGIEPAPLRRWLTEWNLDRVRQALETQIGKLQGGH